MRGLGRKMFIHLLTYCSLNAEVYTLLFYWCKSVHDCDYNLVYLSQLCFIISLAISNHGNRTKLDNHILNGQTPGNYTHHHISGA